jgi:GTP-binding protein HflX
MVFNKIDAYRFIAKDEDDLTPSTRENISLEELQGSWIAKENIDSVFVSAAKGINIAQLREKLTAMVRKRHQVLYPQSKNNDA